MKYIDEHGNRIEIRVRFSYDRYTSPEARYVVEDVLIIPPRKRNPRSIAKELCNCYEYRRTDYDKRSAYVQGKYEEIVGQEKIDAALAEAHQEFIKAISLEHADIEYRVG